MKIARFAIALVAVVAFTLMAWSGASRYAHGRGLAGERVLVVGILAGLAAAGAAAFVQHREPEVRFWRS